ncbi:hypothetical protein HOP60_17410 [Halomonas daqingensis]|uniref:Uncharacterized protein n=1 Tax=Billgrantia desiderata TaxID=52021 RepID=A0ABS9B9F8_9GAMM|nr:hypothetical protein [Halomonas desiderata]MCE8043934.1 hypothetical protein [Halomonas desiderata]MCE8048508.1 hypothetical protein [Halomonas desiderata]
MFELGGSADLFEEVKKAMVEYCNEPNSRLFLFLVFSLNHLREWIAGNSARAIQKKVEEGEGLTREESFARGLWEMEEFRVVNLLCNKSKHISVRLPHKLTSSRGLHVGGWCSDSLDQLYYEIDGVDSREVFLAVIKKYNDWFLVNN